MKISELGEFNLIKRFSPPFQRFLPSRIIAGIGDDCAIIKQKNSEEVELVTTDMLVEEVHFSLKTTSAEQLGYKSLAVNLSDIAAMGGVAESAFLCLALPGEFEVEWVDAFFRGFGSLAKEHSVLLLGGDLSASPSHLFISVCVIGKGQANQIKRRNGVCRGDLICVTGWLGESGAGLKLLQNPSLATKLNGSITEPLVKAHLMPRPHLKEGLWLSQQKEVHAMMDISDGIASDLRQMAEASLITCHVRLDHLPLSPPLQQAAKVLGWDTLELAACGGEDYCLLVAVAPEAYSSLNADFQQRFGRPLQCIGEAVSEGSTVEYSKQGKPVDLSIKGFDHFTRK